MPEDYRIELLPSARKELESLRDPVLKRVIAVMSDLKHNPWPRGCKKLTGSEADYRVRVGDYRVLYEIVSLKRTVRIYRIRHRREAY